MLYKKEKKHPTALYVLAMTELWERLSYYGLRGILVLYLTHNITAQAMGWEHLSENMLNNNALDILGWYMMAAYITPVLGGWIADRYWGERHCIFVGGMMMAIGKFIMALPFVVVGTLSVEIMWFGLAILALGNGLFKPNISALVGKLYEQNDIRRDSAFTLFYMGINVGAFFGFILMGWIAVHYSYHTAFVIAGIGMLIGSLIQGIFGKKTLGDLGNTPQHKLFDIENAVKQKITRTEKSHILSIFIISIFAMLFFSIYEQIAGSFMLFTKNNTELMVGNFTIPPAWLLSVNPAFIIIFAPFMSILFTKDFMKTIDIGHKYAFAYFVLFLAFSVAAIAALPIETDIHHRVHILWPTAVFILITIAELCISPVGLSTISGLSPIRLAGLMMGMFFFFLGIGNKLSTEIGKLIVGNGQGYFNGFMVTAIVCLCISILILCVRPYWNGLMAVNRINDLKD
jgi:POT family proton-dependent oligopeptide transporter